MYPLLAGKGRLALYLSAWVPIGAMLAYLLHVSGQLQWVEIALLVTPLCAFYAFVCLSAGFLCRAFPLASSSAAQVLLSQSMAALMASGMFVGLAIGMGYLLAQAKQFEGVPAKLSPQVPLLLGIGALLYLLAVAVHYTVIALEASKEAHGREMRARLLAGEAELRALKAQVNPHFLFNSLNSISALTTVDPARAREMCILLSEFLRSTLGLGEKTSVTLGDELSFVRNFLAVERVRFGTRLCVEEEIEDSCRKYLVPPLLLQPLVENAVKHGVAGLIEGGTVWIRAEQHGADVVISIENDFDPDAPSRRKNGLGLVNVRKRLDTRYGDSARMQVMVEGTHYKVSLRFPAETTERQPAGG